MKSNNEHFIYELHYKSVNEPSKLLIELNQAEAKPSSQKTAIHNLFKARAIFILGETRRALELLHRIEEILKKSNDHLLLGKYYITLYYIVQSTGFEAANQNEYLAFAGKHAKLSDSKGLACEYKILNCMTNFAEHSVMKNEELLQEAMHDALEADIHGLKVDVHIAFAMLYLKLQLPDDAHRELLLVKDLVNEEINPFAAAQIYNYLGITYRVMREVDRAESALLDGIALAREKYYKFLQIPLLLNLGLIHLQRNPLKSIEINQECLQIIKESAAENSENSYMLQVNLARAYMYSG